MPTCESCPPCLSRRTAQAAVGYMNNHFGRTIERLDPSAPNYLRLVDRLMAERDLEVARLSALTRPCESQLHP